MTEAIAKYAMKKALGNELEKYRKKDVAGPYDPFYERIPHPKKPGKTKKVKKQIPAYIPAHDADILAKARKTAYRLDYALFSFAGVRFGWSSVIGLVPAIGDGADALMAFNLILNMRKIECGLPSSVLLMMLINLALDFLVGLVPFLGDLADAAFRCNGKNVRLLEEHLDKVYKPQELKAKESKLPKNKRPRPASVYVDFDDEREERQNTFQDKHEGVSEPQPVYGGQRPMDEEMGDVRQDPKRSRSRRDEKPGRNNTKSSRR